MPIRALIQAGGRGERLMPLTRNCAKPMVKVGGVPMIERLLRQIVQADIREVTIVVGWQSQQIRSHMLSIVDLPSDLSMTFVEEAAPLGNAAALLDFADCPTPLLFVFADIVTSISFSALLDEHNKSGNDITLCSHVESHRLRLGELVTDGRDVLAYVEKPRKDFIICSGVAVFGPGSLRMNLRKPVGIAEVVTEAIRCGTRVGHWLHGSWWIDVNDQNALARAELEILQLENN